MKYRTPKLIKFLLYIISIQLLIFTLYRVGFLTAFHGYGENYNHFDVLYSFWIGFRFDIQLIAIVNLPILILGGIKYIGIFKSTFAKYFWLIYILLSNIAITVIYVIDFAYYDFFKKMIDSSILRFFYDFGEAFKMAEESYPVYSAIIVTIIAFAIIFKLLMILHEKINKDEIEIKRKKKITIYTFFVIIYIFSGYGKTELYPWRWSEAFYSSNAFMSYLSSNPVTYFVNTLKNTDEKYNKENAQKYYKSIADFLNVNNPNIDDLNLIRIVTPKHNKDLQFKSPNIIFILGESTSYARTNMSGNPLKPTPNLAKMASKGLTYSSYYTPHSGTARSVWTSMTGLVDVERMKTSSRNPMTVEQNMILNSLKNYKKFYFIGGSLSWGNVRGVIGNVNNLVTREESSYDSPRNDVWGISDAHLVGEANKVLKATKEPFFAYIQLAGNHSPNTIPEESFDFVEPKKVSKDKLLKYSFDGKQNELLGQRFLDHSVGRLIKLAKKEKYFDNTIFIFVGDHGLPRRAEHMHEAEQTYLTHTLHTPLILYAPKLIKHKKISYPVSEVDIMATIAGLSGQKYINTTFGRDILDKDFQNKEHYAFYMTHEENPTINLIGEEFIYRVRANGDNPRLFKYHYKPEEKNLNLIIKYPDIAKKMEKVCRGIYENTRYTRFYNSTQTINEKLAKQK